MGRMLKRTLTGLAAMAFVLSLVTVVSPSANADELPGCHHVINEPELDRNAFAIFGVAGREGCEQTRTITVLVRKDIRFAPDKTVAEATFHNFVNGAREAVKMPCSPSDSGNLFTELRTSAGGKSQSRRVNIRCEDL